MNLHAAEKISDLLLYFKEAILQDSFKKATLVPRAAQPDSVDEGVEENRVKCQKCHKYNLEPLAMGWGLVSPKSPSLRLPS